MMGCSHDHDDLCRQSTESKIFELELIAPAGRVFLFFFLALACWLMQTFYIW